eukprot:360230_1
MHDTIYYAKVCRPNTHPMEKYHELQYKLWNTMNIIHITLALEKPRTSATICVYYQKIINCDQYITQHIQDNRQEVIHEIPSDAVHQSSCHSQRSIRTYPWRLYPYFVHCVVFKRAKVKM